MIIWDKLNINSGLTKPNHQILNIINEEKSLKI